ncbi:MAG: hypothetical protein AAB815_00865 [Patescibacteria group bacterium]
MVLKIKKIKMSKLRESINAKVRLFDRAIKSASSDRIAIELLREKKRWLCRNDLFYLCCLTGNHEIRKLASVFEPFCDEVSLMNWNIVRLGIQPANKDMLSIFDVGDEFDNQRLYICHRGYYKTTIVTKVHSLQLLLNFPNIRMVLVHNKQDNSSDNLRTIKEYFLSTEIGRLFPEYIPPGKEWGNLSGFSVACKKDISRSEDSIEAIGVGTEITGRHWDVAKKDDLVTEDSVTTDEQIKKTEDYDDRFNAGHFTSPKFKIQDYSGTRYHFADLYSKKQNDKNVKVIKIKLEDGKGNPTNPERFTPADIVLIKSGLNPWVYNCQHMLEPEDPAKMSFKKEMIQYYDALPASCNFYLLVDPAGQRKKKSDYTAMKVVGVATIVCNGVLVRARFIADMVRDKIDPKQRIDLGIELIKKWKIKEVGWEEVGLADDCFYLEERRRMEHFSCIITPVKTAKIAKEDRIRNILMPEYAKLMWFWPKKGTMVKYSMFHGRNFDLTEVLEQEFLQFPLSEHDDLLDCETFLSQLTIIAPEIYQEKEFKGLTFGDYVKSGENRIAETRKNPWRQFKVMERV